MAVGSPRTFVLLKCYVLAKRSDFAENKKNLRGAKFIKELLGTRMVYGLKKEKSGNCQSNIYPCGPPCVRVLTF